MVPILLCSVAAMAIVAERFWTLQQERVAPQNLVVQVWQWARAGEISGLSVVLKKDEDKV